METVFRELNSKAKVDVDKFKPTDIIKRLSKIYDSGIEHKKKREYADAYIFFRRWQYIVKWLETKKIDQQATERHFPSSKKKDVEIQVLDLINLIKLEHESATKSNQTIPQKSIVNSEEDIALNLPETPNDEPRPKPKDEITCTELFEMFSPNKKNEKRVLIIDVRKDEDYFRSRIGFPKNMIHFSEQEIKPKKVAGVYRSMILHDKEALDLFTKRSSKNTDVVVLVDYNSSLETMKNSSPIALFKQSLEKFDHATDYKRIAVLKGGFEEWNNTYPEHVITRKKSSMNHDNVNDILHNANYDFLTPKQPIENETVSPILSGRLKVGRPVNLRTSPYSAPAAQLMNKKYMNGDNSVHENGMNDKQLLMSNNMKEAKVLVNKLPNKPIVDRTNKPIPGKKLPNYKSVEDIEQELVNTRFLVTQFSKPVRGADLFTKIQLDINLKKEEELMNELAKYRTSQSADSRPTSLYPELPTISKLSLGSKKTVNPPKAEVKENNENVQIPRKSIEEAEVVIKVEPMHIEPSLPETQDMEVEEDIYTPSCKPDKQPMNSGLKRSISSPNLAPQVKKLKSHQKGLPKQTPEFDRSTKPKINHNSKKPIAIAHRDFEPVYSSSSVHPGVTGLKNLGNSCYMNSIIQCLSNTDYLAKYFNNNNNHYLNDLNRNPDKAVTVAEEVAEVIKALWRGQYKSISPRHLKAVVGIYKMQFDSYEQQDSHEFLMFLLDWMHNDLKQKSKLSYDRQLTVAEKEWEKQMNGQSSIISKLFFGQLRSTIECMHCNKTSDTYDTFNSLTLSLPTSSKCTLDDCVKKYVSGQRVTGWKCPSCDVPRDGIKKFDISKLPHIIVIHLNRFHFTDTGSWFEKKNTAVEFPLQNLDLRPYLVNQDSNNINNAQNQAACYNLYAMSNHYGTMEGGHYTAYCKSNTQSKWYKYDDHTVTEVPPSTVRNQSNSAYLLFYSSVSAEPYLNS